MVFRLSGVAWDGQPWRVARSIATLAQQIESVRPGTHAADGTVASKGHDERNPTSDHTVRPFTGSGVVYAIDITEVSGWDHLEVINAMVGSYDPRLKYLIHEDRVFKTYPSRGKPAHSWHAYTLGGHAKHFHVSIDRGGPYDDQRLWNIGSATGPIAPPPHPPTTDWTKDLIMALPTLRQGAGLPPEQPDDDVKTLQAILLARGFEDANTANPRSGIDGRFGPGTDHAIRGFQGARRLKVDGVAGQNTWTALINP